MTPTPRPLRLLAAPVGAAGADWSTAVPLLASPLHLPLLLPFAALPHPEVNDLMTDTLTQSTCPACQAPLVVVRDIDTNELLKLRAERVDEGNVAVFAIAGRAVARRYGRPAPAQPAWQVHLCPGIGQGDDDVTVLGDGDPYAEESPALQQARWRLA